MKRIVYTYRYTKLKLVGVEPFRPGEVSRVSLV